MHARHHRFIGERGSSHSQPGRAVPDQVTPRLLLFLLALAVALTAPLQAWGQTGGEAGIQGSVTDQTGAAIPHAAVVATNVATGVVSTRETTGNGLFTISPVLPGTYTVSVKAPGFSEYIQKNFTIDALVLTALNIQLKIGSQDTSVTVNEAPPALETTNASLGLTIENETYANLPLQLNGAQRDPTALANLTPGAQVGTRVPIIGGTGNYLGQLYLDGLPAQTINQQGDNRLVSQAVSVDAIDQFQVVTSTPPAEYSGAGAENFTMKSGGLKYHGQVSDFIRNTAFDAFPFTGKIPTKDVLGNTVAAKKPVDHQNELSATFGGHAPGFKRLFFFVAYDKYHNRTQTNPTAFTIPSLLERMGDFTELNGGVGTGGLTGTDPAVNPAFLFDPTSTSCVGSVCTRKPLQGVKNGVLTNNVLPAGYISPIAQAAEAFLPAPTNPSVLSGNYSAGLTGGFDNHLIDYRVDFDVSAKHRISTIGAIGTVNYLNNYQSPFLPQPYTGGTLANIHPKNFAVEDAYTISNAMVNQLKFGFTRFAQPQQDPTNSNPAFTPAGLGITNLPGGQAGSYFPGFSFANTTKFQTAQQTWTGNSSAFSTQNVVPNTFSLVDNLQYVRGRHSLTGGISIEFEQINSAAPVGPTGFLSLPFTAYSTANFTGGALDITKYGYSYASFLLGAVGGAPSLGLQPVSEVGGRYHLVAPYVEDTWKVSSKVTIDMGLRWDYLPPFHEVKDRWSFLNATQINAATGTPGDIQLAGSYGGANVSCGCRTPVQTYWKNFGPRVGVTYSPDTKTVFRAGIGHVFSQGGGVGGRGGNAGGTGQLGFNTSANAPSEITSGAASGPSFYLNNSAYFQSVGLANTSLFGPGFTYPAAPALGAASQILNTGNYVNPSTGKFVTAGAVSYADPYFSGRAPDFTFYNFGMQEALTNNLTLAINYVGDQSHHLINATNGGTGNARGYWSNQLNPKYLVSLGPLTGTSLTGGTVALLNAPATPANVAKAQAAVPGLTIPAYFQTAATLNATATIAQGLTTFPQYSAVTDLWGQNVGNFSYNSLQVTLQQRVSKGLTFNFNYTWSKNAGDDGTFRSGYDIPGAAISGGGQDWHQDRIERSAATISAPHLAHAFGVYELPFGKGKAFFGGNRIASAILGGFQVSGIYTYASGTPVAVTYTGCTAPLQGQCEPDVNPNFAGSARIGGSYGSGASGRTACNLGFGAGCTPVRYFDSNGFKPPNTISPAGVSAITLIGNSPRTGALHLTNPGAQNVDTSLRRSFTLPHEFATLQIEADLFNTWNHTIFSNPNAVYVAPLANGTLSGTFGQVTGVANKPRSLELAAHLNF